MVEGTSAEGGVMHASGYPDAAMFDTASPEWQRVCYARWICRLPGLAARLAWFARLSKRHGLGLR